MAGSTVRTRQPVAATLAGVLVILGALPGLLMTLPMAGEWTCNTHRLPNQANGED